jgi:hypothetical protein
MKIHNDYKGIDKSIAVLKTELENLISIRSQLASQVNDLYQSGFKDVKFLELKKAMDDTAVVIVQFQKDLELKLEELASRKNFIIEYYAVRL